MIISINSFGLSLAKGYPDNIGRDLAIFHTAIKMFWLDVGRYPSSQEGLSVLVEDRESSAIKGYRDGGYVPRPPANDSIKEYGYFRMVFGESVNYYIWRKDSERRLGFIAGSWLREPNNSIQANANASLD